MSFFIVYLSFGHVYTELVGIHHSTMKIKVGYLQQQVLVPLFRIQIESISTNVNIKINLFGKKKQYIHILM